MGIGLSKLRKSQAFALWYKSNAQEAKATWKIYMEKMKQNGCTIGPRQCAAGFQLFKSKLYHDLPVAEKMLWEDLAVEEHEVAMKEFEEKLNAPILQEPKDLQRWGFVLRMTQFTDD